MNAPTTLNAEEMDIASSHPESKDEAAVETKTESSGKIQGVMTRKWIARAILIHGNTYDYSLVEYQNAKTKVQIICKKPTHGVFSQAPRTHLEGSGCRKCGLLKNKPMKTQAEFLRQAVAVHGDVFDYTLTVYKGFHEKLIIICKVHGPFEQTAWGHLKGNGCKKCAGFMVSNTEEFIFAAQAQHGQKYDYSKVVYVYTYAKVIIICLEHGEFLQNPGDHLQGHGCYECGRESSAECLRMTKEEFIAAAQQIHGDKYLYDEVVYVNSTTPVIIKCRIHASFSKTPKDHLQKGSGCGQCSHAGYSQMAIAWMKRIEIKEGIEIQHAEKPGGEKRIDGRKVDGFCHTTETIYQFHGCFWHGCPLCNPDPASMHPINHELMKDLHEDTLRKDAALLRTGLKLVTIWEHDFKKGLIYAT